MHVNSPDTLVPYKFEFTTCDSDVSDMTNLVLTSQDLATSYSTYRNRVDLTSLYRRSAGITCLDKVIGHCFILKFCEHTLGCGI